MRILILTATYTPSTNGVAISVAIQKQLLEGKGHEVYVIAPRHKKSKKEKNVFLLPSLSNPIDPDYPIFLPIPNKEVVNILPQKPDIVYFQHPFLVGNIALLLAKIYKCPAVFYYHTQYENYAKIYTQKMIPAKWSVKITNNMLKDILKKTDHIIVGSQTIAKKLKKDGIERPHSIIPITRQFQLLKNITKKEKVALCVSRISKEKNIVFLLKTWKKLDQKEWKLVIVGEGGELEKLKQKYQEKNIVFLGKVPFERIHKIYKQAQIFVFPSKSEVQPGVIFEAMEMSLPIIAFNAPGPKDFTIHNKNSLLANNNQEFEKYLIMMMKDEKKISEFAKQSKIISKKYSLGGSIDKLEKLFQNLAFGAKVSTTTS